MNPVVGIIGCGGISRFHFSGLEKAGVNIKWVCDLNPDTAAPWSKKFGAAYTADYKKVVNDTEIDIVDITTNTRLHKEMCLAAIAAGKAVICEKTLAENADDALEIVRAAEKKGTIFYTSYMKRFIPAVQQAKKLLPSIGRIISTYIRAFQPWGNLWEKNPESGTCHTPPGGMSEIRKLYGGGILVCGGSHILDLACFFLGRPQRLFASVHTPQDRDYDLQAVALLETANGVCFYEATAHPLNRIGFLRDGWDERIEINGTNGRLEIYSAMWDQCEHKASLLLHYDNAAKQTTEHRFAPSSPFDSAIAHFCDNISKGAQGPQSRFTGYDVDELIAHFHKSSASGQALDIKYRI